jgi:6-pyruvoyltetrahydropterin/6-carboxytetrahydropterin synthase
MPKLFISFQENTSTAHRYYNDVWTKEKNEEVYGEDVSPEGLGHNFVVRGEIDSSLLPLDLPAFGHSVWQVSRVIDHQFLTDGPTTLEWITKLLWEKLKEKWPKHKVTLSVFEGENLWSSFNGSEHTLTMRTKISAVHRHWREELEQSENQALYGKCSGLHGHEYKVDVTVLGEMDQDSRLIVRRAHFKDVLKNVTELNGKYLNDIMGNTSGEKITLYIKNMLKPLLPPDLSLKKVAVHETRKNSFYL